MADSDTGGSNSRAQSRASPPASLPQWAPAMNAAGSNFWSKITPLTGLFAILTLSTAFPTLPCHCRLRSPDPFFS
jgi:hypothetical protein